MSSLQDQLRGRQFYLGEGIDQLPSLSPPTKRKEKQVQGEEGGTPFSPSHVPKAAQCKKERFDEDVMIGISCPLSSLGVCGCLFLFKLAKVKNPACQILLCMQVQLHVHAMTRILIPDPGGQIIKITNTTHQR